MLRWLHKLQGLVQKPRQLHLPGQDTSQGFRRRLGHKTADQRYSNGLARSDSFLMPVGDRPCTQHAFAHQVNSHMQASNDR